MASDVATGAEISACSRETKAVAEGRKGDRLESCGPREWPYIAQACLVSSNGSPVRTISRVVAIERRLADNAAEVAIVPAAFASR